MLRIFVPENAQNENAQNEQKSDQTIVDLLLEENPDAVLIDLLDVALIGIQRSSKYLPIAAYDYWWSIDVLCDSNFDYWEAVEYIQSLPSGDNDPIFIQLESSKQEIITNEVEAIFG